MTQAQMWNNCGIWSTYFYPINGLKWPANSKINDSYRCGKYVNPYNCPSFKSLIIVTDRGCHIRQGSINELLVCRKGTPNVWRLNDKEAVKFVSCMHGYH
ncbi:hypothetical protein WR25_02632 [Diploscapter pachys]|uniref:Uncharacterized protein n=1 Tax=Diploscapter pachys TaxID=2018661 RepID=A0A2A2KET5_9BILA|nr:hypothetical protein WR25_02632 [Diploscapter pachys]